MTLRKEGQFHKKDTFSNSPPDTRSVGIHAGGQPFGGGKSTAFGSDAGSSALPLCAGSCSIPSGCDTEPLLSEGVTALRIVSATLPLHAIQVLFFIYYYLLDRQTLAFFVGLLKNLISPVVMAVRMILRDSGILFDVTDADSLPDSLRQYVVARMMVAHDKKAYLTTTGYNRIELFFTKNDHR